MALLQCNDHVGQACALLFTLPRRFPSMYNEEGMFKRLVGTAIGGTENEKVEEDGFLQPESWIAIVQRFHKKEIKTLADLQLAAKEYANAEANSELKGYPKLAGHFVVTETGVETSTAAKIISTRVSVDLGRPLGGE